MRPIRKRLEEARRNTGLSWEIIEKDYILSWVLAGIAANKKLRNAQEAFNIRGKFPWHRQFLPKVMVEITMEEPIQIEPVKKHILHGYEEEILQEINVYSLEEIIAEKMRAILQHFKKLEERGWTRSRARDYYDIWRILNGYSNALRMEIISPLFLEKCKVKEVEFTSPGDFFDNILLNYIAKTWEQWLGPLVPNLPPFKLVI